MINPWEEDGQLVDLSRYPRLAAYFARHETALRGRHVGRRQPQRWYRTIDKVDAGLTARPKLLFADLRLTSEPVLDPGGCALVTWGWRAMTVMGELFAKVQGVEATIQGARTHAGEALERAVELTEQAAAHGWDGVANSMQGAQDALEQAIGSLGNAEDAMGETLGVLRAITEQMSRPEVAEHLSRAMTHLDGVRTALDGANDQLDDARQAAAQAGSPDEVMAMMQGVDDDVDDARRSLEDAKTVTEAERQEAANWGN